MSETRGDAGIFEHLWFGALLRRVGAPLPIAGAVTGTLVLLHLLAGELTAFQLGWHLFDSVYLGVTTWLLLYGGSRADADLRASSLAIDETRWRRRGPSRFAARLETAIAVSVGTALAGISAIVIATSPDALATGTGRRAVIALRWVVDGAVLVHLGAMILRHRRWLNAYVDESLQIDLLHVDRLSVLSNAFVMWLALLACVVAIPIVQFSLMKDANPYEQVRLFTAISLGFVIAGLLFTPILRTRARIIEERERERSVAIEGLRGDPVPVGALSFRGAGDRYTAAELLAYLQFLDGIWEWPIRRNLARIGSYALIPPLAWVLSGLVEIGLSGQLQ